MDLQRSHYALVGSSGTGKTQYALKLARSWKENRACNVTKTYIVNPGNISQDVPDDCQFLDWNDFAISISNANNALPQAPSNGDQGANTNNYSDVDNCTIIFEDVIKLTSSNKDAIKLALNYSARRSNVVLLIITHSLAGNQLMGCLQYIPRFLFFGSGLNVSKSFKIIKESGGLAGELKNKGPEMLLKHAGRSGKYKPIYLNLNDQEMTQLSDSGRIEKVLIAGHDSSMSAQNLSSTKTVRKEEVIAKFKEGFEIYFSGPQHETERKLGHFIVANSSD